MLDVHYDELKKVDFNHLWHPFTQHKVWVEDDPLIVERAEGFELIDVQGNRYLDGVSSLWCNVHGHGVPQLLAALHDQADLLCHSTLLGLSHTAVLALTERLVRLLPEGLERIFYSDSGSAAVEAAIRMSVEWWHKQGGRGKRKTKLAALYNGYHGDTLGSVGLGFVDAFHRAVSCAVIPSIKVHPPHYHRFHGGLSPESACAKSLEEIRALFEAHADEIAAFFIEPMVQGAAGIWIQPPEFGLELERLCRRHDVLLIADEVATGFAKTGRMFAVEHGPLTPDIMTVGKGLTAGYLPLSAAAAGAHIFDAFAGEPDELRTFFFGQTYSGNPLAARVAAANLDLFHSSRLLEQLPERIRSFAKELEHAIAPLPNVFEVRSLGLMCGIELTKTPGNWTPYSLNERAGVRVVHEARKRGAVIRPLGNVMVLMPAPAMNKEQLLQLVAITAESINAALAG